MKSTSPSQFPRIIYSTASHLGGTGLSNVAYHAVHALYQQQQLSKALIYRNRQKTIPKDYLQRIRFQPAKIFSGLSSRYYYSMKREWLDWRAAAYLQKHGDDFDIFHGWTHESLHSLRLMQQQYSANKISIVDRGYAHPLYSKRILDEEYDNYGISRQLDQAPRWLKRFDHWRRETEDALEEFERADYVFVPSDFCYQSFVQEGYPPEKLVMIPRGFDPRQFYTNEAANNNEPTERPFRALFLGLLTVRKGLKYLLEAWQKLALPNAELLLVGTLHEELTTLFKPYLNHSSLSIRHIDFTPNPADLLRSADVFVFPSLDEGSAKVTYEAMACGLPVITTANSGSLVRDGQDGYIVPIRSTQALMEKIEYYYQNRDLCVQMGKTAQAYINQFTWDRYESTLIETYHSLFAKKASRIT